MCITILIFLVLALLYTQTTLLKNFERSSVDTRFFIRDPGAKSIRLSEGVRHETINPRASDDIIILGIDEATIRYFSEENVHWPFPWEIHSQLVNYISTGNPKSIFFDITFIDRRQGEAQLSQAFKNAENVFIV